MEKDSALYQLMDTRMHSVMNGIVSGDGEYLAILRKSDIYSGELERMDLSKEIRLLIDRYVSEQNVHSTCAIDPGLGCSPTCLAFSTARPFFREMPADRSKRNEYRIVTAKSRTGRKGCATALPPCLFILRRISVEKIL